MLVRSSPSSSRSSHANKNPSSSLHPPSWAEESYEWCKAVPCHRWRHQARHCNNKQYVHGEDSVWQFPTTSTNHLSFPHTPIDRTTENFTHVLDDRILNNIHILRVRREENVASKNRKIKELQSCTESCLSDPVLLHLAVVMPIRIHHRLCILHGEQRKVTNDVKQCHVIAEGIKQGIATTKQLIEINKIL